MEVERPFKHVEVVDARTGLTCKVACMACIRGHRATSCGNSSCHQKVFWTVKRPGRPSNACTCRYGVSGRCKCHVAQSACTHRVKGGKRPADCRCQEQGRYCCYIEPHHWEDMYALRKPRVNFYHSLEDLDAAQPPSTVPPISSPPVLSTGTSHTLDSIPNTPGTPGVANENGLSPEVNFNTYRSPNPNTPVRFQMMGVGGPWGEDTTTPEDGLQWQGLSPEAPREYRPFVTPQPVPSSHTLDAQQPTSDLPSLTPYPFIPGPNSNLQNGMLHPVTYAMQGMHMDPMHVPNEPAVDIDRLMADYITYQFPSAICQKCGLNGCTCRNCPPVMQNSENGSWGQGCLRKHVRLDSTATAPMPTAQQNANSMLGHGHQLRLQSTSSQVLGDLPSSSHDPSFTPAFTMPDFDLASEPVSAGCCGGSGDVGEGGAISLSDLLMEDLEGPSAGCCCSGNG